MIPKKGSVPGFIAKAKISSGWTMHLPEAVAKHFALQIGDVLEFYHPLSDLPDDLTEKFELIAVVVKRKVPIHTLELDEETGRPKTINGVPIVTHPFEGPMGKKAVRTTK